ncbi:MAG: ion transporter [Anaerolineales bacterium]|nr:ion transporter [Anaerolineales bacterium]
MADKKTRLLKQTNYEIFIVILTFLSWLNLVFYFYSKDPNVQQIIFFVEQIMTPIFLLDVFVRARFAESSKIYFFRQFGWLDLIGSFPYTRILRAYRVFRTIRSLRANGTHHLLRNFLSNRAETAALTVILAVILLFEFASISILRAENADPLANIQTSGDAIWWTLVTVATVGYGDLYPVTEQGRFVASFVIVAGVGLFGILSGFLASNFLGQKQKPDDDINDSGTRLPDQANLERIMAEIKQIRQEQQKANKSINTRLNRIEQGVDQNKQPD